VRKLRFSIRTLLLMMLLVGVAIVLCRSGNLFPRTLYTGRALDLSIDGRGYFLVHHEDTREYFYTRGGHFWFDSSHRLRYGKSNESLYVHPSVLSMNGGTISVTPDGRLTQEFKRFDEHVHIGQLVLAKFVCAEGLAEVSPGLYRATDKSGDRPTLVSPGEKEAGQIRAGWIELGQSVDGEYALAILPAAGWAFGLGLACGIGGTLCVRRSGPPSRKAPLTKSPAPSSPS
jgi:hypothetical protein